MTEEKNKKEEKEIKKEVEQTSEISDSQKKEKTEKKEEKDLKKSEEADSKLSDSEDIKEEAKQEDDLPEDIKKKLEKNKQERAKKKIKKKKKKVADKKVKQGNAYVKATYNNTIVTLTDTNGEVISWASAGLAGFKGPKKATPYAAQIITKIAVMKAKEEYGLEEVNVLVRGVGTGRESAVRALNANGLVVNSIKDITPLPHNGCRPKKPRRV